MCIRADREREIENGQKIKTLDKEKDMNTI